MFTKAMQAAWRAQATVGDRVIAAAEALLGVVAFAGVVAALLDITYAVMVAADRAHERPDMTVMVLGGIGLIARPLFDLRARSYQIDELQCGPIQLRGRGRRRVTSIIAFGVFVVAYLLLPVDALTLASIALGLELSGIDRRYRAILTIRGWRRAQAATVVS